MNTPVLFRHSDIADPYGHYMSMLHQHPLRYDATQQLYTVYSYAYCQQVLQHPAAVIPPLTSTDAGKLNAPAQLLANHLVRLRNGAAHASARTLVQQLFHPLQPPAVRTLLEVILSRVSPSTSFDWMQTVARVLPALQLLQGYGFPAGQQQLVLQYLRSLVQVMLPVKTAGQVTAINEAAGILYPLALERIDRHPALAAIVAAADGAPQASVRQVAAVNLLGLLIQGYDAGRGLLGNALLDRFAYGDRFTLDIPEATLRFVQESLRYHPPIHHTRRLAQDAMMLGDTPVPAGSMMVLMLAAANRDPDQFEAPERFDPARPNNNDQLSFGSGAHTCIAQHTIVPLTASVLHELFHRYPCVRLTGGTIDYEPLVNARIPRSIPVTLL